MNDNQKYSTLLSWFQMHPKVAVAFSGGVDSTFLLAAAQKIWGEDVLALTVKTPYIPDWEVAEAVAFCKEHTIKHQVVTSDIIPEIANNPENRCYLCKRHLFNMLKSIACQEGFVNVIDGTNADDIGVYRPGLAALQELGIRSPLLETGITKAEVRDYAEQLGLNVARKPSYACLLTRLPYQYEISHDELIRIEKAERYLSSIGYPNSRVRNHRDMARIELEKERTIEFMSSGQAEQLASYFHQLGYRHISIDIEGYRSGSFDNQKITSS